MTASDKPKKVLFLSVGGSLEPLLSSLRESCPDHVVFVVSDGHDGSQSSRNTAEKLLQAEGCPNSHSYTDVPPDDIDTALARIAPKLSEFLARSASVTVDYTGGTKSMTGAMVLAATSQEGVKLQFMAGARIDLSQVAEGTEKPVEIPTELVGLSQAFRSVQGLFERGNYGAARTSLNQIESRFTYLKGKVPRAWRRKVTEERKWIAIFDHWDRFDHAGALRKLQQGLEGGDPHAAWFESEGAGCHRWLEKLASSGRTPSYELVEDLWLNAKRRARLGLYDDAVARLYRLAEAAVQAHIWDKHKFNTDDVPPDLMPEQLREKHSCRDRIVLGLSDSIDLLASIDPTNDLPEIMKDDRDWQSNRNNSILAHGFKPLGEEDWKGAHTWFSKRICMLWRKRLDLPPPKLPKRIPYFR